VSAHRLTGFEDESLGPVHDLVARRSVTEYRIVSGRVRELELDVLKG
jgi:hypothetical protein